MEPGGAEAPVGRAGRAGVPGVEATPGAATVAEGAGLGTPAEVVLF